ncbi:hypothetical protein BsWGS_07560 [Bradybaena similaris]
MCNCSSLSRVTEVHPSAILACSKDNLTITTTWPTSLAADDRFRSTLTPTADILVGCYLIVIEIMAVLLNGSIICLSVWKRKTLKVTDCYVVYLAVSDLGHPLMAYPMIIASSFRHAWVFEDIGCMWNGFTGFFFGVNSMTTLAVMSFSRLIVMTQSNFARNHATAIAASLLVFSLLFALFWATCPLLGWGAYGPEPYKTSCTLVWDKPDKSFVTAAFIGCLAIPAGIMFYSYFRILCMTIRTRHKRLKWAPRSNEMRVWERKEMRLLKITFIMCASFMLCWTPYAVVAMMKAYYSHMHLSASLSAFPALAAKTSHVIDPIIYCGLNKNFSRIIPEVFKKSQEIDREQLTTSVPLKTIAKVTFDQKE